MDKVTAPKAITHWVAGHRRNGQRIGLVPTMGALHEGHLALIDAARKACDKVLCSIFVNPLQFNDPADLQRYPRMPEQDMALLAGAGCDAAFLPEKAALFAGFAPMEYDLGGLDGHWEGPSRPGHFQGVVNVVERLFFYTRPDEAFFGEKDRQQLMILQYVAKQQLWPERITPCPTLRAPDGLALSSRNMRLNEQEREQAVLLHQALQVARRAAFRVPVAEVENRVKATLEAAVNVKLDHFGLANPHDLSPIEDWEGKDSVIALIAAWVGPVRLIDNIMIPRE